MVGTVQIFNRNKGLDHQANTLQNLKVTVGQHLVQDVVGGISSWSVLDTTVISQLLSDACD